ncbi:MAG: hypothetical protein RMK84_10035 [Oscillochloridaceae bacterium]|nr:hypothetical protein [Chloroflexaceae bacterium]MDW8390451.1 hypothetical protein [Oscillochloridaceae bacterium]
MAEQSWWRRLVAAIDREYERRIRAASLVTEYGAPHHAEHEEAHEEEGEVAEIVNVPRGTAIGRERRAASHGSGSERED